MKTPKMLFATFMFAGCAALAQHVEINNQNKTIAISSDATVSADAEIAVLHVGYHNYAKTKDESFSEAAAVSNAVAKTLSDLKVPKDQIESNDVTLAQAGTDSAWPAELKLIRQFRSHISWKIRVPVGIAETVLAAVIKAGANESTEPEWQVVDPSALQAKAGAAALTKARKIADQMAKRPGIENRETDLCWKQGRCYR